MSRKNHEHAIDEFSPLSFVIPAHNEEQYLEKTIRAIQDAIGELKLDAEIVVVNDDSTDRTAEVATSMGANVVDVELRNIGAVRNAGAKAAQHDWLFFVDADTQVRTETIRRALVCLAEGDVGGGAHVELEEQQSLFWFKQLMVDAVVLVWQILGGWAAGCFMFCRREAFESFGGFDENYFAAEEYFFSRNLKRLGRFRLVPAPVITSARKLHRYSTWELVQFVVSPLRNLRKPLTSKKGLEILYEDKR